MTFPQWLLVRRGALRARDKYAGLPSSRDPLPQEARGQEIYWRGLCSEKPVVSREKATRYRGWVAVD